MAMQLKRKLIMAVISVCIAFVALTSSTYAWFIANNQVKATSATISAKTDSFVLQIAKLSEGAQRGSNQSLVASSSGHKISPSSTNNLKDWYASLTWGQDGLVHSYMKVAVDGSGMYTQDTTGTYLVSPARYAFIKSEYILYTVNQTGICDVYLAADGSTPAVQVTASGTPVSNIIPQSLRVGITIQDLDGTTPSGNENLVVVYAPYNETGKGNDKTGADGWTYVKDTTSLAPVTYPHIYGTHYSWTDSTNTVHNYAASSDGGMSYVPPATNQHPIAGNVDFDGVIMRVYIWLEGTDEQCINNSTEEDTSTFNVNISLAGVMK